eukprot:39137_1
MVREIVHCQIGQCGNHIGNAFWDSIGQDHKLDFDGKFKGIIENNNDQKRLDKINVYYTETGTLRYQPRACLIDLEPGTIECIKASPTGPLFKPDNFVFGASGAGNNWVKGHETEGAEIIDEIIDIVRRETENCEYCQGFQLTQSIGGGTGSGLGTLLLIKMRDNYPDKITSTHSVFTSPKVSDVVVEPYNATLTIHKLLENSDITFVYDNEALFNISNKYLHIKKPKYDDLNFIISNVMNGVTTSLRFQIELNSDLRRLGINLVPFPRLHFLLLSHSP